MNRVKAQAIVERGDYDPCDYEGIYNLFLTAFGNIELARRQRTKATERYADRAIEAAKTRR